jgi:hypothetical protein
MRRMSRGLGLMSAVAACTMIALPLAALPSDEPQPTPSEETTAARVEASGTAATTSEQGETATATTATENQPALGTKGQDGDHAATGRKARSLADLASGIDLESPEGGSNASIVITNENLRSMGQGAVVSEGSNLGGSSSDDDLYVPAGTRGPVPTEKDIDGARHDVELLEAQADAVNQAADENQAANMYTGGGPQYRAPGVTDPLRDQQQKVDKELADARARLSAMEKAAAEAARRGISPANEGSSSGGGND